MRCWFRIAPTNSDSNIVIHRKKKNAEEISELLKNTLQDTNELLDAHEKIKKIIVMKESWLVEINILTASFKIKRNEIEKRYVPYYEEWYSLNGSVNMVF